MSRFIGLDDGALERLLETLRKSPDGGNELRRVMQELQVHQVELEQQNRELKEVQQALEASRDRYADLYDWAPVGYCTLSPGGTITQINLTGASMLGSERTRVLGTPFSRYLQTGQHRALLCHLHEVLRTAQRQSLDVRLKRPDDVEGVDLRLESELSQDDDGAPTFRTALLDITEAKRALKALEESNRAVAAAHRERQLALEHRAQHDALTGLPNRALFTDRLEQAIAKAHRAQEQVGVLFIDIDRFKILNDSFGHPFGDEILKQLARRLVALVRKSDTVARLSGDEFILLISPLKDLRSAAVVARKLIDTLKPPCRAFHQEAHVAASVGIGIYPSDGASVEELVRNADAAMYRAKKEGGQGFRFYEEEMTVVAFERVLLESNLRQAVENGELILHYQPQVALGIRRIVGVEGLVRWQHPRLGLLPPSRFIPLAEETGLIREIGNWVLRRACTQRKLPRG